jgi:hypothetical protein
VPKKPVLDSAYDVRRQALPRSLPVFLRKDLAYRWNVDGGTITRWVADGIIPTEDVRDAEGIRLGWTWSAVTHLEANNTDIGDRFRRVQITPDVRVEGDDPG